MTLTVKQLTDYVLLFEGEKKACSISTDWLAQQDSDLPAMSLFDCEGFQVWWIKWFTTHLPHSIQETDAFMGCEAAIVEAQKVYVEVTLPASEVYDEIEWKARKMHHATAVQASDKRVAATMPAWKAYHAATTPPLVLSDSAFIQAKKARDAAVDPAWEVYKEAVESATVVYLAVLEPAQAVLEVSVVQAREVRDVAIAHIYRVYIPLLLELLGNCLVKESESKS